MAANVETMFYVRETPWHGLETKVMQAPDSLNALKTAGLDWMVLQEPIYTDGKFIEGYKANVRSSDRKVLGVVTDRYKVVQNEDAFAFADAKEIITIDVYMEKVMPDRGKTDDNDISKIEIDMSGFLKENKETDGDNDGG